eukprot:PhM_4_TR548/c1_g1_i1/m.93012
MTDQDRAQDAAKAELQKEVSFYDHAAGVLDAVEAHRRGALAKQAEFEQLLSYFVHYEGRIDFNYMQQEIERRRRGHHHRDPTPNLGTEEESWYYKDHRGNKIWVQNLKLADDVMMIDSVNATDAVAVVPKVRTSSARSPSCPRGRDPLSFLGPHLPPRRGKIDYETNDEVANERVHTQYAAVGRLEEERAIMAPIVKHKIVAKTIDYNNNNNNNASIFPDNALSAVQRRREMLQSEEAQLRLVMLGKKSPL